MMDSMCDTMVAAYERVRALGLLDPPHVEGALRQLAIFVRLVNDAADELGLPWSVTFRASALRIRMGIDVYTTIEELSLPDFPFGAQPADLDDIGD